MPNKINLMILPLTFFMVGGCSYAINKTLSPPVDTKWVNVEIQNPSQYTKPFPLEVRYISHKCQKKRVSGFDGSVISEPSYNVTRIPMQQQSGNIWKAKVAMTGGGSCKWTLSAVNLGIEYIDATHLGKELVPGTAVGATIALDNDASRNGQYDSVVENYLRYSPKYYPVIERWSSQKNSSYPDKLSLFGEEKAFKGIRLNVTNEDVMVQYRPSINEEKKVEMIFPYEKKKGASYIFIYPNGLREQSKDIKPDFNKVDNINAQ